MYSNGTHMAVDVPVDDLIFKAHISERRKLKIILCIGLQGAQYLKITVNGLDHKCFPKAHMVKI